MATSSWGTRIFPSKSIKAIRCLNFLPQGIKWEDEGITSGQEAA